MTKRVCAVGAVLHAAPSHASRVVGYIHAGQELIGTDVEGEPVNGDRRWMCVTGYLPYVRVDDQPEAQPKSKRTRKA